MPTLPPDHTPGLLHLSPAEQTTLTNALSLEAHGYIEAAHWLRMQVVSLRPVWTQSKVERLAVPHVNPTDVFRHHRGSLPATPQPVAVKPAIRPDQTTA